MSAVGLFTFSRGGIHPGPHKEATAGRPIEPESIVAKFRDDAGRVLPPARVAAIEQAALSLDELPDVSVLMAACRL